MNLLGAGLALNRLVPGKPMGVVSPFASPIRDWNMSSKSFYSGKLLLFNIRKGIKADYYDRGHYWRWIRRAVVISHHTSS